MAAHKSFTQVFFLAYLCMASPSEFIARKHSSFGHTYKTLPGRSRIECCTQCKLEDACISVNFLSTEGKCELNSKNPADFPYTNISSSTNTHLYYMDIAPCPESWVLFDRNCYLQTRRRKWQDSEDNCREMGASLTDVTDVYQNNFIADMKGNKLVWIGLGTLHVATPLLWSNGKPVNYTNFADGEPDNASEHCVGMGNDGRWGDHHCSGRAFRGVCKKRHY